MAAQRRGTQRDADIGVAIRVRIPIGIAPLILDIGQGEQDAIGFRKTADLPAEFGG